MPCSVFRVVRQEKGYSSFFNVCLEFFPHFRARWRPVPNDHGLGGQISLSFPRIAGHRGFPAGQAGRGGHQGKGFPHFSRRTENQDVGERPGGEGEEGNVIPDEVVMRKRNEAEAGFLALRQGDFFPDGGVFPCQLQRGSGGGVIHGKLHRHVLRLVGIEPLPQHFQIQHQFPVIYLSLPDSDAAVAFRPVAEGHDADGRGQGKGGQPLAHTGPERGVWLPGRGLHVRGNPDFRLSCAGFFQVRDGFLQKCRNICASIRCLAYSQVRQGFRSGNLGNGSSGGIKQGKAAVAELRESGFHQRGDGIPKGAGFVRMGIHGGGTIQNQQDFIQSGASPAEEASEQGPRKGRYQCRHGHHAQRQNQIVQQFFRSTCFPGRTEKEFHGRPGDGTVPPPVDQVDDDGNGGCKESPQQPGRVEGHGGTGIIGGSELPGQVEGGPGSSCRRI